MPTQVQTRRGTTAQHTTFTGAAGELTVDTDKKTVVVHDGTTAGGAPLLRENGSQNAVTTGTSTAASFIPTSSTAPTAGLYAPSSGAVAISTNGSQRVTVNSSGNVGIGTTNPGVPLEVNGLVLCGRTDGSAYLINRGGYSSSSVYSFYGNDTTGISNPAAGQIGFLTSGGERARIDSSGRLLVGTSTPVNTAGSGLLQVVGGDTARPVIHRNINDQYPPIIYFSKARGTGNQSVSNGDSVGFIGFLGYDGSNGIQAANIECLVDGTPGANDMPGRLVFSTTADGASSPTLALKIDSNQITNFSTNNSLSSTTGWAGIAANPIGAFSISRAGSNVLAFFHTSNANGLSGTPVGTVSITTTATAYNTSSDYRLKENVIPVIDGITRLQQLKPSRFNFIADPDKTVDGFVAHEVQAVVPEAVTGAKDEVDADGNPIYQGIDQSKLVPLLTAALQEAIGEIESLKARVAALESA